VRLLKLGEGFDFVNIDRETVRISHAYVRAKIYKDNTVGSMALSPLSDPAFNAMMKPYTRFRYRAISVTWLPVVSTLVSGIAALECTAAPPRAGVTTTIEGIGSTPGSVVGPISLGMTTVCDVRAYLNQWFTLDGESELRGTPNITWDIETESKETLGYFVVSYVVELTAPSFTPPPKVEERIVDLREEMAKLTAELATLALQVEKDETRPGSVSIDEQY